MALLLAAIVGVSAFQRLQAGVVPLANCSIDQSSCLQRQTLADERQANAADAQLLVTWFEVAALGATLIFTAWAALAASKAAQAANASVQLAEQMSKRQLRAYLEHSSTLFGWQLDAAGNIAGITVVPQITNSGQTPARCYELRTVLVFAASGTPNVTFPSAPWKRPIEIGRSRPWTMTPASIYWPDLARCAAGLDRCFLLAYVRYADVFQGSDDEHVISFCVEIVQNLPPVGVTLASTATDYFRANLHDDFSIRPA